LKFAFNVGDEFFPLLIHLVLRLKERAPLLVALGFERLDLFLAGKFFFQRESGGGGSAGILDKPVHPHPPDPTTLEFGKPRANGSIYTPVEREGQEGMMAKMVEGGRARGREAGNSVAACDLGDGLEGHPTPVAFPSAGQARCGPDAPRTRGALRATVPGKAQPP
jgi:hypothetical protein